MRESPLPALRAKAQLARLIAFVDGVSTWVGRASAWLIAVLTALIAYEVFSRYVLGSPHDWAFDVSYMLYGAMFMLAGAYALAKGAHVRGDLLYGSFPPRMQAALDLVLYLVFFLPGIAALAFAGYTFAEESWAIREGSPMTPDGPPVYPFKAIIPVAGGLLLLQGLVEILRCFACLASGEWPARAPDVEEVNLERLRETVDAGGEALR
jgi:TRAP-type mannitol/chloroaromatic compound transport system permease small subunit